MPDQHDIVRPDVTALLANKADHHRSGMIDLMAEIVKAPREHERLQPHAPGFVAQLAGRGARRAGIDGQRWCLVQSPALHHHGQRAWTAIDARPLPLQPHAVDHGPLT